MTDRIRSSPPSISAYGSSQEVVPNGTADAAAQNRKKLRDAERARVAGKSSNVFQPAAAQASQAATYDASTLVLPAASGAGSTAELSAQGVADREAIAVTSTDATPEEQKIQGLQQELAAAEEKLEAANQAHMDALANGESLEGLSETYNQAKAEVAKLKGFLGVAQLMPNGKLPSAETMQAEYEKFKAAAEEAKATHEANMLSDPDTANAANKDFLRYDAMASQLEGMLEVAEFLPPGQAPRLDELKSTIETLRTTVQETKDQHEALLNTEDADPDEVAAASTAYSQAQGKLSRLEAMLPVLELSSDGQAPSAEALLEAATAARAEADAANEAHRNGGGDEATAAYKAADARAKSLEALAGTAQIFTLEEDPAQLEAQIAAAKAKLKEARDAHNEALDSEDEDAIAEANQAVADASAEVKGLLAKQTGMEFRTKVGSPPEGEGSLAWLLVSSKLLSQAGQ